MIPLVMMILGSFTTPMRIGTNPVSMLWLLPLVAAIAVVYKATKVHRVQPWPFAKETTVLFGSIILFIVVAALILHGIAWIVTGQLSVLLDGSTF